MKIRTLSQQQVDSMSLEDACRAIQKLYTPEEWKRMAHTVAATFTPEQIVQATEPCGCSACVADQAAMSKQPTEIIIRPVCGHTYSVDPDLTDEEIIDLRTQMCPQCVQEMIEFEAACEAEYQASQAAQAISSVHLRLMMWNEPCCGGGCLVQTPYRDEHNQPLCLGCARIQSAWDALQRVPAYVERRQS